MDTQAEISIIKNRLESGEYPLIKNCFGEYIRFALNQNNYENFDIIKILQEEYRGWVVLESLLTENVQFFGMSEGQLVKYFGSRKNELKNEPEKFFDLLYEPHTAKVLNEKGFKKINRIKSSNERGQKEADFVAWYGSEKFAIEIKTIRPSESEEKARIGHDLAYSVDSLRKMFEKKIKDILPQAHAQLKATTIGRNCNKTLLAIWVRREATVNLLNVRRDDFGEIYRNIKQDYSDIDYFVFNGYWYPKLKQIVGSVPII